MTEQLRPQAELRTAPPEDIQALGHLGVGGAMQVETGTMPDVENMTVIAETADYQGNWMLAQQERMTGQDFQAKYDGMVDDSLPSLKEGSAGVFDKPEQFQAYHKSLAETLADRSEHVYATVGYAPAKEYGLSPHQTGRGGVGEQGTVFSDATTMDGTPLTDRQKDIIAAHEAYHGMVKAPGTVQAELSKSFDSGVYFNEIVDGEGLKQPGYLQKPDELMARMAQLKNYFGMKDGQEFTKGHLEYARAHYVEDTGLDNSMSVMFRIISSRTEPNFLRAMNTLPV